MLEVTEWRGNRMLFLSPHAIQSAMRIARPCDLELAYSRAMMAYLLFHPTPETLLMIGLGGGSLVKFIRKHRPETKITAVEIDGRVIVAARAHFEVPPDDDALQVIEADGALYMHQHPAPVDVILSDSFEGDGQAEVLAAEEYYANCRRALKPHGVLVANLSGCDPNLSEYVARLWRVFDGEIGWLSTAGKDSVLVFAFANPQARKEWETSHLAELTQRYGLDFAGFVRDFQWADADSPVFVTRETQT